MRLYRKLTIVTQLRASFVSVNLFSLLCDASTDLSTASMGAITKYGGPIVYLIVYSIILFIILVWFDSGSKMPRRLSLLSRKLAGKGATSTQASAKADVAEIGRAHV